jgi:DNA-binding transcriptional MerR regulator
MIDTPLSIYLIIPSSIFILLVGVFIFLKNRGKVNFLFFLMSLAQFLWAFGTFIVWQGHAWGLANESVLLNKIFVLSVFLIPTFLYHFTIEFCKIQSQKIQLFFAYAFSLFLVFVVDVDSVINGVFFYKWGDWSSVSIIHYAFSLFIILLLSMSLYNLFKAWQNRVDKSIKKDTVLYLLLGISIFGLIFIDFLPVYGINIYPLFYLTIPVYALIMAYVLIEKNPLASIITTDILVSTLLTLLASLLVFPDLEVTFVEKSVIFILICVLSFVALKYTHQLTEEKGAFKEKMGERAKELEEINLQLKEAREACEVANTVLDKKVQERTRDLQGLNDNLEKIVSDRTKELERKTKQLEEKIVELEQFGDIFVNRENKMVELKDRIRELEDKLRK